MNNRGPPLWVPEAVFVPRFGWLDRLHPPPEQALGALEVPEEYDYSVLRLREVKLDRLDSDALHASVVQALELLGGV